MKEAKVRKSITDGTIRIIAFKQTVMKYKATWPSVSPRFASIKMRIIKQYDISSVTYSNILINIQQDATLHNLFYLEITLHISGGNITHHQERIQLYLQHLVFVTTPLLLSAAIVEELEMV
jgi:hypothetical protein